MKSKLKKIDAVIIIVMIIISVTIFYQVGYKTDEEENIIPIIEFIKDDESDTIFVNSVSNEIFWKDIEIEGACDKSGLGRYISEGDQITNCEGTINIKYIPTNTVLFTVIFSPTPKLPTSILLSNYRDVSPEDEGAHFKTILNTREWWYYTVIFDKDSELPGWSAFIGFCHLSWGDLKGTFKPDLMIITLHSPDGKKYGGMINKDRGGVLGLGILGNEGLEASTPGVDLKFDDSWAKGEAPNWHIHAEDNEIDEENEIILDFDFFSTSTPLWLHSNKLIDKGEGVIANYIFTGCEVTGEIILNGIKYDVKGIGHHEHSWSPGFLKIIIDGWDQCHISLDNGWNIYYSNYYITKQRLDTKTTIINPYAKIIITTDKGETLTLLENIDLTIQESDRLFLLLKMPTSISVKAKPNPLTQILLYTYGINLDLKIINKNTYDKTWKIPTYVGMKVGLNTVNGIIKWNDDDGSHEININGTGTIWNMRKF
jgi:hypothetical protein